MADIVISIVAKVAELLVVPIGKHISYPFKYKSNMEELKEQAENLKNARVRVQRDIDAAERRRHLIEDDVQKWMKSVDEFTEEVVKNIIGSDDDEGKENKAKKLCSIGFCPNLMARYSLSKKAEKTAKDGVNLLKEGKFEKVSCCPDIQRTGSIYIRGYNEFDSRTPIFQEIMQTLEDDNVNIIGVHGMGGVGKTTLVKRVVGKAIDDKLFDVVVMADVTQTPDIQKIQAQIADVLNLTFEKGSLDGRAAQLRDTLKKEKSILLVLDDLWEKLDLKDVGIPFGEGGNAEQRQCKLLLTSRNLHVLRDHMNTQKNFQLETLTDEEAGNLFWQIVGDSTKTSDFDTTGVEIIRHCAGLPVAIATIAGALKNESHFVWKDAVDQLKKSNPRHIEGMEEKVYSVIKWSYDFLRSEEEKSVFLLCSLYDASFNIDIDYLLQYCMGSGVFQGVSTIEQARNRLHKIIDKLKASNLLLDGNTKMCVKMHDIVHAVAFSIASTDKLMFNIQDVTDLKETLGEKLPKNSTAMSLPFKDVSELPERLECPELKLLVLLMMEDTSLQIPDPFFEGMEGLKVLHLNNIHMLSLPSSLCRLTSLQTLRLNYCLLGDIAVIGALKRIEILSFLGSTIEQLPRELSQLIRLRLLDLRYCSKLKLISPNLISSLTRLEELYIGGSFVGWDVEGRSNASLAELKQLSRLKRLDICVLDARIMPQDLLIFGKLESYIMYIGDVWDRDDPFDYEWKEKLKLNNLDNYFESSRILKLKLNDSNIYSGNDFRLLLNRAEDLCLDELKGVKNVVCQLDGEGFPQLKHLYVRNDSEIQCIISAIGLDLCNVFPKLESLLLNKLVNLKKICHGQLAPESFNKLRIMKVQGCDTLNHLFSFSMVKNLSQLKEIEVTNCKNLEVIIFKESEEQVHQNDRISRVEFTQLRTLTLQNLPRLTSFVFHSLTPNTESQEIVSEDQPRGSMSHFSQNVTFLCLKELTLSRLPKLLHLWKEDSQARIFFENLTILDVSYCENLKTLVPSSVPLEKLTTLTVRGCNGLMNLMTLSTAKTLVRLKTITIEACDMLEEIITDVGDEEIMTAEAEKDAAIDKITLSMLNSITLARLPNLITFHSGSNTLECPSLTDIFIANCPKMEAFVLPDTKDPSIRSASFFNEKVVLPISASLHPHSIGIQHLQAMSSCPTNLTRLTIVGCDNLKYLFRSSMAESLLHLGFLQIFHCKLMEVVIITQEERKSSTLFPKLKKLKLKDLPELRTFCCFIGNLIELPSVNKLYIKNCPTMQTFASDSLFVDMLAIEEEHEEVNTDREENLPSFFDEKVALPCLKRLVLRKLPGLLHLWMENSQPSKVFENLSHLRIVGCGNLTTLLPSSVSLQNLKNLFVQKCDGLINLVPFSTAQSLKQLKIMVVSDCKMIEEIIIGMGDEVKDKIVFDQLIILELLCLPSLTSFCKGNFTIEFPYLRQVDVMTCLKMKSFSQGDLSTPKLQRLKLKEVGSDDVDDDDEWFWEIKENGWYWEGEEDGWNWEGDLNTSIQQFFEDRLKKMAEENRFFKLKTGAEIPLVGLGTWSAAPGVVGDAVSTAVKVGYRHIDCAPLYGNEKEIGCALKKLLDDGVVKREELWITSKLWCTDHLPEDVPRALDRTLQDLQLDYLDLYLIHWPVSLKKGSDGENPENLTQPDIPGTWRAMEALYDSGKARAIGVSNFSIKKLGDLLEIARVPPAVNQVECHLSWKQTKLHAFCKSKEVHLTGYSPLGSPSSKRKIEVLKDPILNTVAQKLGKSPAQVALRWGLQMGHSVLPKSTNEARLKENYDVFGWYIPEDLLAELSEIVQERLVKGAEFVHENFGAYRTLEELWDGEI